MKHKPEYEIGDLLLFNSKYLYKVVRYNYDLLDNIWDYYLIDLKTKQQVWFSSNHNKDHLIEKLNKVGRVLFG